MKSPSEANVRKFAERRSLEGESSDEADVKDVAPNKNIVVHNIPKTTSHNLKITKKMSNVKKPKFAIFENNGKIPGGLSLLQFLNPSSTTKPTLHFKKLPLSTKNSQTTYKFDKPLAAAKSISPKGVLPQGSSADNK